MNLIAATETVGLLAALVALGIAGTGRNSVITRGPRLVFYMLVLTLICTHGVSVIEWSWPSTNLDSVSDFSKTLLPLAWLFFFYVYLHDREHRQRLGDERKFRILMEQSLAGMYIIQDDRFVYANTQFLNLFGYTNEELENITSVLDLVHEDDRHIVTGNIRLRFTDGQDFVKYRFRGRRKDGVVIHVEVYGSRTVWNERPAVIGILVDITEREQLQAELRERERKLETLMGNLPGMVFRCRNDPDWTMEYTSEGCINLTGYSSFDLIENATVAYGDLIEPEFRDSVWNDVQTAIENGTSYQIEYQIRARDNRKKWVWEQGCGYFMDGELKAIEGFIMDITEHKQTELAVIQSEQRLQDIVEANPSVIYQACIKKGNLICSFVTENLLDLLGYESSEIIDNANFWTSHIHSDDKVAIKRSIKHLIKNRSGIIEYRVRHRDGKFRWVRDTRKLLYNLDNEIMELIGTWSDVTDIHSLTEKLSYSESHDLLTGLINRGECSRRITQLLDNSRIDNAQHAFCELNIDQFKVINDTCGNMAGDSFLQEITNLLRNRMRKVDRLAKLGGDEFGILVTECASEEAETIAGDLLKIINEYRFEWNDKAYRVSVRIGIVIFDKHTPDAHTVFSRTNIACHTAREQGGNCIHLYNEDNEVSERIYSEMQWAGRLHEALEKNQFLLYCQPIVPVTGPDRKQHYEVLLRMQDADGNTIAPGIFLPPAEKYGLAVKIDAWVVNNVFGFFNSHPDYLDDLGLCAINLSGQSVGNNDLLQTVISNIDNGVIPGRKLCFEVTETAMVTNLSVAIKFMNTLKQYGCRFSLDDFGTGFSSYSYLKTMPVDYLKIDGYFIRNIIDDSIDLSLVRSINDIGHVMGKKTIAEFVENDMILARLANLGVDYAQGYGIGKPEPMGTTLPVVH